MPNLSGSLNLVSGSLTLSTGSLNVLGGDITISGSSVVTSNDTGSFITNNETGSFVTTGSNSLVGNQTISGSLLISGSITPNILQLPVRTTDPGSPVEGMIMASGSAGSSQLFYYNGTSWIDLTA